jgi:hypothetical protein
VGELQQMQRGELDADRQGAHGAAGLDPLSGQLANDKRAPGFQSPAIPVAEQLQALVLGDDIAGMPLGQVVGLIRLAVAEQHVNATEPEIRDEAERRWLDGKLEESPVAEPAADVAQAEDGLSDLMHGAEASDYPTVSDLPCDRCDGEVILRSAEEDRRLAQLVTDGRLGEVLCDACGEADPVETRPEDRADLVVDVAPDGIVEGVRPAEMTPDRGEGVGQTHHTVTDDEPRFSGAGAKNLGNDLPFGGTETSTLIPMDGAFLNERHKAAPELANLAEKLFDEHGFLERLRRARIDYKWRRKGTNSKGKRAIGKLERVSGIWSAYVPYSFVIWLAADTARLARFGDRQVEAALFHQLCHISEDAKGNWIRVGHDFEGFGTEVRHYGPWTEDLKIGSEAFTVAVQLGLDLDADDEEDDEDLDEPAVI